MKKTLTLLALTIIFSVNAQIATTGTNPSGAASSAIGYYTSATGYMSTAMGRESRASGDYSTAMGRNTKASDYSSTVIGQYNSSGSSATSATSFSTSAPAFVIGNGTSGNLSDAFKVMFNGDAYISSSLYLAGTAITATAAEINLLDGLTTVGSGILSSIAENGNTGVRLSTSNASNHGNIGANAVDLSYQQSSSSTKGATGQLSTAMGSHTTASGSRSTAMGSYTTASGVDSTAIGHDTTASGDYSTAIGENTTASGETSIAMGYQSTASGVASTAMGKSTASGTYSTAMGYDTVASGIGSTAMGRSIASDFASTVIGQYNSSGSSATSATSFSTSAPAFVIGNGTADNARSDAFKVMFNGDATLAGNLNINSDKQVFFGNQSFIEGASEGTVLILNANNNILFRPGGTTAVNFENNGDAIFNGDVKVTSDKRLKSNIISLGGTLAKLLQIDGKSYTMKKDENKKQKIGLLAQDIEKVFPELVSESNGIKSVNYQGLVPVLINALKEQDSKMKGQDTKLNKQQAEINRLKKQEARIERLEKLLLDSQKKQN
ncbi:MAG: hypothetical protein CMC82_06885 [Flavobacteriaceae bacterium]|nr:hypothetical protein [Flavobacteriaceae bacterium]